MPKNWHNNWGLNLYLLNRKATEKINGKWTENMNLYVAHMNLRYLVVSMAKLFRKFKTYFIFEKNTRFWRIIFSGQTVSTTRISVYLCRLYFRQKSPKMNKTQQDGMTLKGCSHYPDHLRSPPHFQRTVSLWPKHPPRPENLYIIQPMKTFI